MPLRTRLFIIIGVIVLLVLAISVFLLVFSKGRLSQKTSGITAETTVSAEQTGAVQADTQTETTVPIISQNINAVDVSKAVIKPLTSEEAEKNSVKQLARIFTERYGTYSTDNKYQNIKELKEISTDNLWSILSGKITAGQATGSYSGVNTRVISTRFETWSVNSATMELDAIRTDENSGGIAGSRQQKAVVGLDKSSGAWLVDKFEWK